MALLLLLAGGVYAVAVVSRMYSNHRPKVRCAFNAPHAAADSSTSTHTRCSMTGITRRLCTCGGSRPHGCARWMIPGHHAAAAAMPQALAKAIVPRPKGAAYELRVHGFVAEKGGGRRAAGSGGDGDELMTMRA